MTQSHPRKKRLSKQWRLILPLIALFIMPGPLHASDKPHEIIDRLTVDGWQHNGPVRQFSPENMYEQINGRAEYYIAYDVVNMTFAGFSRKEKKGPFINLFIYDMGNATNAFGVYAGERSEEGTSVDLGRAAYTENANYYIWKGQYYITIMTSGTTADFQSAGRSMAQQVAQGLPDSGEPVWGLSAMPEKDLVPETLKFARQDAMGLDFMKDTYMARYRKNRKEVTQFLSKRASEDVAKQVLAQYKQFAEQYGKAAAYDIFDSHAFLVCDMGDYFDVVFQKGALVAGVVAVEDKAMAIRTAREMFENLR